MTDAKKALIADALSMLVEKARNGGPRLRIGLMASGSELGAAEIAAGGLQAQETHSDLQVIMIGPKPDQAPAELEWLETDACETDIVAGIEQALHSGRIAGAVAMHYPFPIGVTTIGRILTPARGKPMLIAACTGSSAAQRVEALLRNALYGIAVAKANGINKPSVAFLNLDGAGVANRALTRLRDNGYQVNIGSSNRGDGGSLLRGNDLVSGAVDVLVCDSLTGNALVKVFSAYSTGGGHESLGWGYGPSVGAGWDKIISIVSRASAAPVIANALAFTAAMCRGKLPLAAALELQAAALAGLDQEIEALRPQSQPEATILAPPAVPVGAQVAGVDVLDLENAVRELWKSGIYAESAMGCTGPVILVQDEKKKNAVEILTQTGFI